MVDGSVRNTGNQVFFGMNQSVRGPPKTSGRDTRTDSGRMDRTKKRFDRAPQAIRVVRPPFRRVGPVIQSIVNSVAVAPKPTAINTGCP
ncbi:hypothetical protein M408DRAFT_260256 [Serendipita vermifera MAFF 305830]|uniref:Uncharacterized protein n=1 Tax=Serendipita vermifera MAFF 305830 TaxID=933852 RepID=A0A0C2XRA5_SERVB|nr:hypothetical protein M408DRAFT_260256 [Serendipita vermifera MAFF 305830]